MGRNKDEKTVRIKVFGRVQGVTFRHNTNTIANKLGLRGFVRNELDGSVLIIVQGKEKDIDYLIEWCKKFSPGRVSCLETDDYLGKERFKEFKIEY